MCVGVYVGVCVSWCVCVGVYRDDVETVKEYVGGMCV